MRRALAGLTLLALVPRPGAAQTDSAQVARLLTVGSAVTGRLTPHDARTADGTYAQAWRLRGTPGRVVTVDLASKDFDAFLLVRGAGLDSATGPLQDDDSGGHCNARLTLRIPPSGECTLVVTTSARNGVGDFGLAVRAGAIPASLAPCHR